MRNYRKHIDDFFREKLGKYRETPPPEAWGELEGRLDGLTPAISGPSFKWAWHVAIISVLLVLGVSVGKKFIGSNDTPGILASGEKNTRTSLSSTPDISKNHNNQVAGNNLNAASDNSLQAGNTKNDNIITGAINADNHNDANANPVIAFAASKTDPLGNKSTSRSGKKHGKNVITNNLPSAYQSTAGGKWTTGNTSNDQLNTNTNITPGIVSGELQNAITASPDLPLSSKSPKEETTPGKTNTVPNNGQKKEESITPPKPAIRNFARLEAGVKAGYESGFGDASAAKLVLSPYLQYNLSPKVALLTQPAIKYANQSSRTIGKTQSYYQSNSDGNISQEGNTIYKTRTAGSTIDTIGSWTNFRYTETHDSIVKSYKHGGSYTEFELPVLLKYNLTKQFSVYGGVNLVYNNYKGVTENTTAIHGISRSTVIDSVWTPYGTPVTKPGDVAYQYTGTPFSDYKGNPYPTYSKGQLSMGYMLGFSYNYNKKWLFDALVQQAPSVISNNNYSTSQTTFYRLSIGYKLTK